MRVSVHAVSCVGHNQKGPFVKNILIACILCVNCALSAVSHAAVRLPALIDHHMVMQRGEPIPVWGWANKGEKVEVFFDGEHRTSTADDNGVWRVVFPAHEAGGPYEMTIKGTNLIKLYNIAVGDVWLCSGQSNMEWPVKYASNARIEVEASYNPRIRFIEIKKAGACEPQTDCEGQWQECTPKTAGDISAVAYFFAQEMTRDLKIPIGIVQSAWGGTPISVWTSLPAMEAEPACAPILRDYRGIFAEKPEALEYYYDGLGSWFEYCFVQMSRQAPYGNLPKPADPYQNITWVPSYVYNAMIAPLSWYPLTGVIWYQGESNVGRAHRYRTQLPLLIGDWRKTFGRPNLPFIVVQLANFGKHVSEPGNAAYAEMREAQLMTAEDDPHTTLVVAIDAGEVDNIHYKNKQSVGSRSAIAALGMVHGRRDLYEGPVYRDMTIEGDEIRLRFDNAPDGLMVPGDDDIKGFTIAGADRKFYYADSRIEGNEIVVSRYRVQRPVAVRYGWAQNPMCNVYNNAGLPMSPFRTDNWPGITEGK